MVEEQHQIREEDEIDLIALVQTFWAGRRTIFKFVLIFGLIGLFIAIFSPKEYTASTVMVPSSSSKGAGGNLGGLAAMAGFDLNVGGSTELIPPSLYPKIIQSIPFKKELIKTPLKVSDVEEQITFSKYYTEIHSPGALGWLKKYTIGLPGVIINGIRGDNNSAVIEQDSAGLIYLSQEEQSLHKILKNAVTIEVNDKEGFVKLEARMPEAVPAAQLATRAQQLLQNYIIDFKSKKAIDELNFIEKRYEDKEKEFRKAALNLARFQDQNKNVISAQAATTEKRLQSDYNLAYGVYSELAKQIEQQKIKVKENTPVFTIIEPVSVPVEKSKPRKLLILAIWLFLGIVVGIGLVVGKSFYSKLEKR
ncbi:LPS O-antigen subunit length determinant protein (WzzB/FepE family) [Balneicella halophila]|uniref:LPS O-antigen subunit length determinant protein (WzzB/FepE family) n=1 Tax=Balneicella halophila TaxID=1537566 RepID=A0A7L4UNQ4_BALHA|nr:Wzz/FepE/Etk N-terminal domain-containing protein [Balneicella halophila]PVX50745.1 LPS O-antigen subunit length determinant protein (WzzB/FepE family) [Balneicella halophila]